MLGFDIGDAAFVDVADVAGGAGSLHVKLLESALLQQGDAALFAFGDVNQHFF